MESQKRREILSLLQEDGRRTHADIAVMVGETPEAVAAAVSQMEEERVILQYPALIDWEKAGVERVAALIFVKTTPQRDVGFDRLAERIARFSEVRSCYLISGTYDLCVEVEADSLKEVARFVSERLSVLEGVASTMTHFLLKRYKHDGVRYGEAETDNRLAVTP